MVLGSDLLLTARGGHPAEGEKNTPSRLDRVDRRSAERGESVQWVFSRGRPWSGRPGDPQSPTVQLVLTDDLADSGRSRVMTW